MKPLRVELRAKNNVLWHAIFDAYGSVAAFCRAHRLAAGYQHPVGRLLNLRASPWKPTGALTPLARRLCDETGLLPEDLFPRALYAKLLPAVVAGEYEAEDLQAVYAAEQRALVAPSPEAEAVAGERGRLIDQALQTLTPREEYIMRRRYLEDPDNPPSYAVLGRELKLSVERVRQIEISALKKLRQPGRLRRQLWEHAR